jgi:hypothetical protein
VSEIGTDPGEGEVVVSGSPVEGPAEAAVAVAVEVEAAEIGTDPAVSAVSAVSGSSVEETVRSRAVVLSHTCQTLWPPRS